MSEANSELLPLDQPRVIALRDGKHVYTFHFNRITQTDWDRYFNGIRFTTRNDGKAQLTTLDLDTPGLELFEEKLIKVEGYAGDFTSKPDWQKKIPPRHSHQVAWLLRQVAPSENDSDTPLDPESIEVRIDALWSKTGDGDATLFTGLVHRFAAPRVEQKKRYYNAGSQSTVVGGTRNGTTIYAKRHRVLLEIYDQLIQSVDGYSIDGGTALVDVARIRSEMDAYHKFVAVQQIFQGSAPAPAAEEAVAA